MAVKTTLPASIIRKIEAFIEVKEELAEFLADQRCAREEMSERWQESERAEQHEEWTAGLEEMEVELAGLIDTVEEIADDIPEFGF